MAWTNRAHIIEATAASLALLFAILALSTESWVQVRFDMVQPPHSSYYSYCADWAVPSTATCFGLASCQASQADISVAIFRTLGFAIPPSDITKVGSPQPTPFHDACMVLIHALKSDQRASVLHAVMDGRLVINVSTSTTYTAHSLIPKKKDDGVYTGVAVHVGLFHICAEADLPFDPQLSGSTNPNQDESDDCRTEFHTIACVSTSTVCSYLTSDCFEDLNATVRGRVENIPADAEPICNRAMAVAVLQSLAMVAALLAVISAIYGAIRFEPYSLEEPRDWLTRMPIFVAFALQLCSVAVWGSLYSHGKGLMDWLFPDGQPFWVLPPNVTMVAGGVARMPRALAGATALGLPFPFPSYQEIADVYPHLSHSFAFACVALGLSGVAMAFLFSRRPSVVVGSLRGYHPPPSTSPHALGSKYSGYGAVPTSSSTIPEAEEQRTIVVRESPRPRRG